MRMVRVTTLTAVVDGEGRIAHGIRRPLNVNHAGEEFRKLSVTQPLEFLNEWGEPGLPWEVASVDVAERAADDTQVAPRDG